MTLNPSQKIMSLQESDTDAVARLISEDPLFQKYDYTYENAARHLKKTLSQPGQDLILLKEDGRIQGFAWFIKEGTFQRSGYLKLIVVAPDSQCRGVGRILLEELESRYLKPNGIFILVTSTNTHARSFYEKLGYRCVGEVKDFVKAGFTESIYYRAGG